MKPIFFSRFLMFLCLLTSTQLSFSQGTEPELSKLKAKADSLSYNHPKAAATTYLLLAERAEAAKKDSLKCHALFNAANAFRSSGGVDTSIVIFDRFFRECGATYPLLYAKAKIRVSRAYGRSGNLLKAKKTLHDIESEVKKLKDQKLFFQYHHAFASLYHLSKEFDSMLLSEKQALQAAQELADTALLSTAYTTLGVAYTSKQEFDSSLFWNNKALQLANQMGDSTQLMYASINIGALYRNIQEYDSALYYLNQASAISALIENMDIQIAARYNISYTHYDMGNYKKAFESYATASDQQVEKLGESHITALNEMEVKYETSEKEKKIQRMEAQDKVDQLQRNVLIAAILIFLIGIFITIYIIRLKSKTNQKLNLIYQSKSNFYANISHELKTPLTLIKGPVDFLLKEHENELSKGAKEQMAFIKKHADKLSKLINQLLLIAKSEDGKPILNKRALNVSKLAKKVVKSHQSWIDQKSLSVKVDSSTKLFGETDPDLLEKILDNLLSNAIKFSPEGGEVKVSLESQQDQLKVTVEDEGEGIDAKEASYIFDRFYSSQNQTNANTEGSGLGLSLSKQFAELLGGSLAVENRKSGGACFVLRLPFVKADESEVATQERLEEKESSIDPEISPFLQGTNEHDKPTILVVDDHEDIRSFVRKSLGKQYRIIEAANGEAGFEQAKAHLPDVVISDVMMPKVDGMEFLSKLKSDAETNFLAVIMLTAKGEDQDKIEAYQGGAEGYLAKPFNVEELNSMIQSILNSRKTLRKRFTQEGKSEEIERRKDKSAFEQTFEKLINQNISNPDFKIGDHLDDFAMSQSSFQRNVKKFYQINAQEFMSRKRMNLAKELLESENVTVAEVAYTCGFNSLSYFSTKFKDQFNFAPTAYQKQAK